MARLWDRRQRGKRIYACDSFRGLPGAYENLPAGNFATQVPRLTGVRIVEGFFEDSLTPALAREVGRVSLAHFDADLHSSTACALDWVTPLLQPGSLLLFDEFLGEDPAEERAFLEWSQRTGVKTAMLAMFGREPAGRTDTADRRALLQVVSRRPDRQGRSAAAQAGPAQAVSAVVAVRCYRRKVVDGIACRTRYRVTGSAGTGPRPGPP